MLSSTATRLLTFIFIFSCSLMATDQEIEWIDELFSTEEKGPEDDEAIKSEIKADLLEVASSPFWRHFYRFRHTYFEDEYARDLVHGNFDASIVAKCANFLGRGCVELSPVQLNTALRLYSIAKSVLRVPHHGIYPPELQNEFFDIIFETGTHSLSLYFGGPVLTVYAATVIQFVRKSYGGSYQKILCHELKRSYLKREMNKHADVLGMAMYLMRDKKND